MLAFPLILELLTRFQIRGVGEADGGVPEFPSEDGFGEAVAAILPATAALLELLIRVFLHAVRPWDARHGNEVSGNGECFLHLSQVVVVPHQPLAVVREVVNLVREGVASDHLRVVHARRGFLLP